MSQPYILVVNDDTVVSMVTERILGNHGYHVATAKDGRAVLDSIEKQTPDLIILDIQMPDRMALEQELWGSNACLIRSHQGIEN